MTRDEEVVEPPDHIRARRTQGLLDCPHERGGEYSWLKTRPIELVQATIYVAESRSHLSFSAIGPCRKPEAKSSCLNYRLPRSPTKMVWISPSSPLYSNRSLLTLR